jgi:trehalose 6-phosphate synthase/phosphatase
MASFRNHRVVIASLFLPTTAVLGESPPITPDQEQEDDPSQLAETTIPAVAQRLADNGMFNTHSRQPSQTGPLKSIVDDLKDKVRTTPTITSHPSSHHHS